MNIYALVIQILMVINQTVQADLMKIHDGLRFFRKNWAPVIVSLKRDFADVPLCFRMSCGKGAGDWI